MPPKKDAKKGGGDDDDAAYACWLNGKKIEVLKQQIVLRDLQISQSAYAESQYAAEIARLEKAHRGEEKNAEEVTNEMNRQNNEMRESFNERIEQLKEEVEDSAQEIAEVQREIEEVRAQKDAEIEELERDVQNQTAKLEQMAYEFANMLKETLDKMSQRIEVTHATSQKTEEMSLMKRLGEFNLNTNESGEAESAGL